jgi:TonB-linked SusC/RagA family outer membrane protein
MKRKKLFILDNRPGRWLLLSFLALIGSISVQAQEIAVTGTVTDEGSPIPGVTVLIEGTSTGTVTNSEGRYSINASMGDVLRFSFIGMKTETRTVDSSVIEVEMQSDFVALDEVIAIGYGSVRKKEITGAVARVRSEELENTVSSDLGTALQGQVAGVNVTASSGAPGASSNIQIRGISSISGTNTPLFVVDGIPQEGDPRLSINEIQSIDVLKDAASSAIYGTRGSAGVILITTKKGEKGEMRVNASGSYGIRRITSGTPLLTAEEQTYVDIVFNRNVNNNHDEEIILPLVQNPYYFQNETNLGDLVFIDNAPTQEYSVNVSGGSEDITYNVVGGYYKEEGIVRNSGFERFNARSNTTYNKNKWSINAGLGISLEEVSNEPSALIAQSVRYFPYQPQFDPDTDTTVESPGAGFSPEATALNWVMRSLKNEDRAKRDGFNGNINVTYEVIKGLKLSTRLGSNVRNVNRTVFQPVFENYDSNGQLLNNPKESSITEYSDRWQSLSWDSRISYSKSIRNHNIKALAAYTVEKYTHKGFYGGRYGVADNSIKVINGATVDPFIYSGNDYTNSLIGILGRIQYDFNSRYMLSASIRQDGSSRFSQENRWGIFPSVSAAWNVSEEPFWTGISEIANSLKLRGSYGTTGNQSFAPYSYSSSITQGISYAFGRSGGDVLVNGAAQTAYANALVKWETSVQANVGVDLTLLRNKLTFTADYYNTQKEDMLFPVQLPRSAGVGSGGNSRLTLNVGNMTNIGTELALQYRDKFGPMNFSIAGTFAKNKNEITYMSGDSDFIFTSDGGLISADPNSKITVLAEGYEAGAFFINETDGVVDTEEKLAEYQTIKPDAQMGDLIYKDANGSGDITDADRVYGGSGLPDFETGLNMNFKYKGFDLNMMWYGSFGHEIMNGSKAAAYSFRRHKDLLYAWSEANPTSSIPAYRGDSKAHVNYAGFTDLWLEDGSFVRLKDITFGYTLPESLNSRLGVGKMRVYVSAQNALTITGYEGFDPEVGGDGVTSRGLDKGNYPVSAFYLVGLKLDF